MVPALKRRGDFIEALFKAFQRLRLKCCTKNAQHPHQGPALHVVELIGTHLAVHLARLLYDAWQGVERVAYARALGIVILVMPLGSPLTIFFVIFQSAAILEMGIPDILPSRLSFRLAHHSVGEFFGLPAPGFLPLIVIDCFSSRTEPRLARHSSARHQLQVRAAKLGGPIRRASCDAALRLAEPLRAIRGGLVDVGCRGSEPASL
jgi:hypothetical protein